MIFGLYDIHPLHAGRFMLDGGAMFGVVPKNLWSRTNPSDEQNRIKMAMRALLLRSNERTILIDTGAGTKLNEKLRSIYAIEYDRHSLDQSLAQCGLTREDITDVILTHLHFDHAGGSTALNDDALVPAFPNAVYYVQRTQWEWALRPSERDRASFFPENYMPVKDADRLVILDGPEELFLGVYVEVVNGHTFGMQLVRITQRERSIVFCADLIPLSSHVPAPYIMGYDLQPLLTLKEKTDFLSLASRQHDILFFEHDPVNEAGTVRKTEKGFTLDRCGSLESVLRGGK